MVLKPFPIFLFLLLALTSCESFTLTKEDVREVTLQNTSGAYVTAALNDEGKLKANRTIALEWERFTLYRNEDQLVTLQASNGTWVGSELKDLGLVQAGFLEGDKQTFFKLVPEGEYFYLKDFKDRFIKIGPDDELRASSLQKQSAQKFLVNELENIGRTTFSRNEFFLFGSGVLFLFLSLVLFHSGNYPKYSLILLMIGAFLVRLFVASLDPHLGGWDEQFHALVAKNMMEHPFKPMLIKNPVLWYDELSWHSGHIWLHKQPLFLWQMALSMELFGVTPLALRLPSVLMSTLILFFIFRIGKLSTNTWTGYLGAVLFATSNFVLEITAGAIHTDHNDVAFLFYVAASIWSWVEYENSSSKRRRWLFVVLIGLFSGLAILVKWMVGLLVYSGWGLSVLLLKKKRTQLVSYLHILISGLITLAVALPWQLYILQEFPKVSLHELQYNSLHFFEVLEGHSGGFFWHFDKATVIYGINKYLVFGAILWWLISMRNKPFKIAFTTYIFLIYLFFSLAATKMLAFTLCISFLGFIALGYAIWRLFDIVIVNPVLRKRDKLQKYYQVLMISLLGFYLLNIEGIRSNHTLWDKDRESGFYHRLRRSEIIRHLDDEISNSENYILFNVFGYEFVPALFFNDFASAYGFVPDEESYRELLQKGYGIIIMDDGKLPDYISEGEKVIKVKNYWR